MTVVLYGISEHTIRCTLTWRRDSHGVGTLSLRISNRSSGWLREEYNSGTLRGFVRAGYR
jgi:hypothetical protein